MYLLYKGVLNSAAKALIKDQHKLHSGFRYGVLGGECFFIQWIFGIVSEPSSNTN